MNTGSTNQAGSDSSTTASSFLINNPSVSDFDKLLMSKLGISAKAAINLSMIDRLMRVTITKALLIEQALRNQSFRVEDTNARLSVLTEIQAKAIDGSKKSDQVNKTTWVVNGRNIFLNNGRTLVVEDVDENGSTARYLKLTDALGNQVKLRVSDSQITVTRSGNQQNYSFQIGSDSTFVLADNLKISLNITLDSNDNPVIKNAYLIKADQQVTISNLDSTPVITGPDLTGTALDKSINDGHIFREGSNIVEWSLNGNLVGDGGSYARNKIIYELPINYDTYQLTPEEIKILKELNVVYTDASGIGVLTKSEWTELGEKIKNTINSQSSLAQSEVTIFNILYSKMNQFYTLFSNAFSAFMRTTNGMVGNFRG